MITTLEGIALPQMSMLLCPQTHLAGCVFAAIVRDTRAHDLPVQDRFNHFPASPLVALTVHLHGQTHLVPAGASLDAIRQGKAMQNPCVAGPQSQPVTSWSAGPVFAVTVGFYPDAWARLTGCEASGIANRMDAPVPEVLAGIVRGCTNATSAEEFWRLFQDGLAQEWHMARRGDDMPVWSAPSRVADWARSLILRAATTGAGRSMRAAQRRVQSWVGQDRQSLEFFAKFEDLHRTVIQEGTTSLAGVAHQAGYADQSHMGRAVRRATGYTPAQLNRSIATQPSFWCYRLLGERF